MNSLMFHSRNMFARFAGRHDKATVISFGIPISSNQLNTIRMKLDIKEISVVMIDCRYDLEAAVRPQVEKDIQTAQKVIEKETEGLIIILPPPLPVAAYLIGAAFSMQVEGGVPEPNLVLWMKPTYQHAKAIYVVGGIE